MAVDVAVKEVWAAAVKVTVAAAVVEQAACRAAA